MKLSFSLSSKQATRPGRTAQTFSAEVSSNGDADRLYMTEYDPVAAPTTALHHVRGTGQGPLPPPPTAKKIKNVHSPSSQAPSQLTFEVGSSAQTTTVAYGLNLRKRLGDGGDAVAVDSGDVSKPLLADVSCREGWKSLPDQSTLEEFEDVPVDEYGAALLTGLGWSAGRAIGRRAAVDTQICQHSRCPGKAGFGYTPPPPQRASDNGIDHHHRGGRGGGGSRSWLRSNIRVRIVSKSVRDGKLFLKKGVVVDVVGPRTCDVSIDGTDELLQSVDHDHLETALPRHGGRVLVLSGKYEGVLGNLVEKRLDEETGIVEDADDHKLFRVRLGQIAEFVGDPSLLYY